MHTTATFRPTSYSQRVGRPLFAALVLACVILLLKAGTASSAFHVFGTRFYNYQKYGSSISIEVPPHDPAPNAKEVVLHRNVVQSDYGTTPGLVQIGVYRSGSEIQLDSCGSRSGWTFFGEWKAAGTAEEASSYHCQLFSETNSGNNTVEHIWRSASTGANEWEMEINNSRVATYKPSFGIGYPYVGGEIGGLHVLPATSQTFGIYGGTRPWHSWSGPGKASEFEITNNANTSIKQDTNWYVGPVPGEFSVEHWYP